ncbi:MAG: DUF305 domain-containing protein [Chloroflexota bacterium]|nr:DUF305 domain-containing protein [Chloroflexia bacterium]MDQ3225116.1 DUF305 domain-containing protein [Chloroflexota bacterium]
MRITRRAATAAIIPVLALILFVAPSGATQDATPTMNYSCETAMTASPMAGMVNTSMGTPAADDDHDMAGVGVEFDLLYIDMMVPHHASIIALAQAAQNRLTDDRLQTIAGTIVADQQAEIEELRGLREQWYGSTESMPMDSAMMDMMTEMMPGMGDMNTMAMQMDPVALITTFCDAEDPDLAFIELTIPHHEMAIRASQAALEQATHDEIRTIAERVIQDQQREIDELEVIRAELSGDGTPTA